MSTCNRLDRESLGSWPTISKNLPAMLNIEIFNACRMPFWLSNFFLFFKGHFTKMCSAKFPPFTVKASPKIACHKILQLVDRNIVGLRSWHSSRYFQIPNTLQFRLNNFDSAMTTTSAWQAQLYVNNDFPNWIGWRVIANIDWNLKHWMHWCECDYAVFERKIWIGLKNLTLENWPKTGGLCLWSSMVIKCIMLGI